MTDLDWITDGRPVAAAPLATDGAKVTDLLLWTAGGEFHVARLSFREDGRMLVNGEDEEREDFLALVGAFDEVEEADLPAGQICYLGTWN